MIKKIIPLLIILIISVSCLSLVSADNDTNDTVVNEKIEDLSNYITVNSISGDKIVLSDGFTGFCLDSSKKINSDDKFTSQSSVSDANKLKLAIIECYKQNKVNEIGSIISKVIAKDTSDSVVGTVMNSNEQIGNHAVVKINNSTEATFDFEFLKSSDGDGSDLIAYKISEQKIIPDDVLAANENDTNESTDITNETTNNDTTNNETINNETNTNETNDTTNNETINNETNTNETNKTDNTNETNTIIVKNTTTTVIKQNTTKIITKTNDTPQNETIPGIIMKHVGNPIFILVVVLVIIGIVGLVMRKR